MICLVLFTVFGLYELWGIKSIYISAFCLFNFRKWFPAIYKFMNFHLVFQAFLLPYRFTTGIRNYSDWDAHFWCSDDRKEVQNYVSVWVSRIKNLFVVSSDFTGYKQTLNHFYCFVCIFSNIYHLNSFLSHTLRENH